MDGEVCAAMRCHLPRIVDPRRGILLKRRGDYASSESGKVISDGRMVQRLTHDGHDHLLTFTPSTFAGRI